MRRSRAAPPVPPLSDRQRPGLSETLTGVRAPDRCQSCGAADELRTWNEHDAWDRAQTPAVAVVLCARCSDRLIQPHPRFYTAVDRLAPFPGVMAACVACRHRDGLQCRSALLKVNGGPGLGMSFPKPQLVHFNYGGGRGEWKHLYSAPPECAGRELP
jgi:hypothetical protein